MINAFDLGIRIEQAYRRQVLFAVEVLDAVTLERVSAGIDVTVAGLAGRPIVNSGGLFVWLREGNAAPQGLAIDPGNRPYQAITRGAADMQLPLTRVELPPRRGYPFTSGATALVGMLVLAAAAAPARPDPVTDAEVWLRWLGDDAVTWHDSPTRTRTDAAGGFVAVLRLAPADVAHVDASGAVTVQLRAQRAGGNDLGSLPFALRQGRVVDALPPFAWDELQP